MRDLFLQAEDPDQTRGRNVVLVKNRRGALALRTTAQNGSDFFIEPNGYPYGEPLVWSRWPIEHGLPAGHSTHYFGDGYVCLGPGLAGLELFEILYRVDGWAKGLEQYLLTGRFPPDASAAFAASASGARASCRIGYAMHGGAP